MKSKSDDSDRCKTNWTQHSNDRKRQLTYGSDSTEQREKAHFKGIQAKVDIYGRRQLIMQEANAAVDS
jgi:hypothetical protein